MAVIKQGILGGFSGKVAGVVGSSWKGISVMKSLPQSVANPQTAGQVAQRGKFAITVAFAVSILTTIVKPLWDRFAIRQSGYNAFIQSNIDNFDASGLVSPADLTISSGKMASSSIDSVATSGVSPTVTVNWTDDSGSGYKLASDEVYAVCYNETQDVVGVSSAVAVRSDGTIDITLPANLAVGDVLRFYLAFRRADGTIVSDTSYANTTA